LDTEILRTAPKAVAESAAYLPGWRVVFNKHSTTRKGDAANLEECASHTTWGYVYRVSPNEKKRLIAREGGYDTLMLTVLLVDDVNDREKRRPVEAFTFVARKTCAERCGAPEAYVRLLLKGARLRGLPEHYVLELKQRAAG
jgi:hypothetical protein